MHFGGLFLSVNSLKVSFKAQGENNKSGCPWHLLYAAAAAAAAVDVNVETHAMRIYKNIEISKLA